MPDNIPNGFENDPGFVVTPRMAERVVGMSAHDVAAMVERGIIRTLDVPGLVAYADMTDVVPPHHVRAYLALPRDVSTYGTTAIADLLGFSADVVRRLCDRAELHAYRMPGGFRLVTREAMAAYLADNPGRCAPRMGLRPVAVTPKPRRRTQRVRARDDD